MISVGRALHKKKSHLLIHQRIHTGEKAFLFDDCGKSFAHRSHFRKHQREHTGEKPFTCDQCDKSFSKRSITKHQRVHIGEEPFPCDQCDKSFLDNIFLRELVHSFTC